MPQLNLESIKAFSARRAIYLVLITLILVITVVDPRFLSLRVMRDILLHSSTKVIIALGASLILISGGVDLSAGRTVGLAAVISASMLQTATYGKRFYPDLPQLALILPLLIAIAVCLSAGMLNGFLVSKLQVPPFIATLGTMVIIYGVNSIYFDLPPNDSQPIAGLRGDFTNLGSGYLLFVPIIVLIAFTIACIIWVMLNNTQLGKNLYAIGGNKEAARVSGINVGRNLLVIYCIAGTLYGIAGTLEAARTGGASNNYGNMYELDAIAACVVGGVSTSGGVGTVLGVVTGVLIFGVINYGLTFVGLDPYLQLVFKGIIIAAAVALDIRKYITKK